MRVHNETVRRRSNKIKGIAGDKSEFRRIVNIQNIQIIRIYNFGAIGDVFVRAFLNDNLNEHGCGDAAQGPQEGIAMTGKHEVAEAAGVRRTANVPDSPAKAGRIVVRQDRNGQTETRNLKPADHLRLDYRTMGRRRLLHGGLYRRRSGV